MPQETNPLNFYKLHIDQVFNCAEQVGFFPTGEYFQLNSYENRVFDLFLDPHDSDPQFDGHVIVKVYRPQRWSRAAILEEHEFIAELQEAGIPAIAPLELSGNTVVEKDEMFFSFFPKARGRMPQELGLRDFRQIGFQLARLHNIGEQKTAEHRPFMDIETYGWNSLDNLQSWIAPEVKGRYLKAGELICQYLEDHMDESRFLRIHGDCHKGNILQTDPIEGGKENFFVDFDDFVNGPEVQDFWMLFSGKLAENQEEVDEFLNGYCELRNFDDNQLDLIPALRGLRIIYYANWIARRWEDPSFPNLFPEFRNYIYWVEEVEALEKIAWDL